MIVSAVLAAVAFLIARRFWFTRWTAVACSLALFLFLFPIAALVLLAVLGAVLLFIYMP